MNANDKPKGESGSGPENGKPRQHAGRNPEDAHPVPLFLRDGNEGMKGNAQDEKDEMGE